MRALLVASLFLVACAENGMPPDSPAGMSDLAASPPEPPPLPPGTLRRSDVRRAVADGVGAFLQHVEVDERPVFVAGRFHGFRVAALRGDPRYWRGVDLRPGDVVTRVNGMSIERPEDAAQALQSLEVASELRVELERGGEPRELRFAIIEDEANPPSAPPAPRAATPRAPAPSASAPPASPAPPPASAPPPPAPPKK
jgi:hypothetical protein